LFSSFAVNLKPIKLVPALIAITVIALTSLVRLVDLEFFDRLERMTYDWRAKAARHFPAPVFTNFGVVYISDDTIATIQDAKIPARIGRIEYGLHWPRHIYARVLRELHAQGAKAVAFDVLFSNRRGDHAPAQEIGSQAEDLGEFLSGLPLEENLKPRKLRSDGEDIIMAESDFYFAWQLSRSSNAILAAENNVRPEWLFVTNASAIGDISSEADADGVLRRARAFQNYRVWHHILELYFEGVDISHPKEEPGKISFMNKEGSPLMDSEGKPLSVELNERGEFDVRPYLSVELAEGVNPWRKPYEMDRVWHMGIVLAAQELKLNLANAEILLQQGKINLRGEAGVERVIPVDADGYFYINWELEPFDKKLQKSVFEQFLIFDYMRQIGQTQEVQNVFKDKLVVIGSMATGNDLTDRGATPLDKYSFLFSKHWNVANSIITGRFINRSSIEAELIAIALLGALAAWVTWQLPPLGGSLSILFATIVYVGLGVWLFVQNRDWLPLVLPVAGGLIMQNVCLVTWRVIFEQTERRRVKSVFSRIVSPDVVNELLGAEKLSLDGGARRDITVLFADVRGFTELTDVTHERAVEYVKKHNLEGDAAKAYFDGVASETLKTVNLYLALVADMVKKHNGTLDKYIGDCVMAFWGAPIANSSHAVGCVRAAIDAQRAMFRKNLERAEQNKEMEKENEKRIAAGEGPLPPLATLSLGTGINTGQMTVGLMGSEDHILNYTVFGREVNLASRLEHESGRGRIVIGEATYNGLLRDDPELASKCVPLEPVTVKGIRTAVNIYEVPWRES
jgi:class 3 adenylate cyclase/CHASE2 domain-containing sensor protein